MISEAKEHIRLEERRLGAIAENILLPWRRHLQRVRFRYASSPHLQMLSEGTKKYDGQTSQNTSVLYFCPITVSRALSGEIVQKTPAGYERFPPGGQNRGIKEYSFLDGIEHTRMRKSNKTRNTRLPLPPLSNHSPAHSSTTSLRFSFALLRATRANLAIVHCI